MKKYRFFELNGSAYHKNFVLEMVRELTKNATCIIVSHDPSIYDSGLFPRWSFEKPSDTFIIFNDLMIIRQL